MYREALILPSQIRRMRSRHHGVSMIYSVVMLIAVCGITSLAVDLARVQLVKTELQRTADACVHFGADSMTTMTDAALISWIQQLSTAHTADGTSIAMTAADIEFGTWNSTTKTFTVVGTSASATAMRITARRTTARGNPIQLYWGRMIGKSTIDVTASSIALVTPAKTTTITINATQADPWLAGMPAGSTASYDDTTANAPSASAITLIPGTYISFSNATGTVKNGPTATAVSPTGDSTNILSHGADSPGGATPASENGIADVVMPINSLLGVFLDGNAPNTTSAPARRDYTTAASRDQSTYGDIQLKQPFYVGDGKTSGLSTQQFLVPTGATRLFLGTMDGHEWSNNVGSFSVTVTTPRSVSIVK